MTTSSFIFFLFSRQFYKQVSSHHVAIHRKKRFLFFLSMEHVIYLAEKTLDICLNVMSIIKKPMASTKYGLQGKCIRKYSESMSFQAVSTCHVSTDTIYIYCVGVQDGFECSIEMNYDENFNFKNKFIQHTINIPQKPKPTQTLPISIPFPTGSTSLTVD